MTCPPSETPSGVTAIIAEPKGSSRAPTGSIASRMNSHVRASRCVGVRPRRTTRDVMIAEAVEVCESRAKSLMASGLPMEANEAMKCAEAIRAIPGHRTAICGTVARYQLGCRCATCRAAKSVVNLAYKGRRKNR